MQEHSKRNRPDSEEHIDLSAALPRSFQQSHKLPELTGIREDFNKSCDLFYGEGNWRIEEAGGERFLAIDSRFQFPAADIYFVSGNPGKISSAKIGVGDELMLCGVALDISEEQEDVRSIALYKAKVASAVLGRPILCDDSGFEIEALNGYPGSRVGRELESKGIEHFLGLAPAKARFIQVLAYFEPNLAEPKLFTSFAPGELIAEQRGDRAKPFAKSELATCFVLEGQSQTIAEMTESEYRANATSNRWEELRAWLSL